MSNFYLCPCCGKLVEMSVTASTFEDVVMSCACNGRRYIFEAKVNGRYDPISGTPEPMPKPNKLEPRKELAALVMDNLTKTSLTSAKDITNQINANYTLDSELRVNEEDIRDLLNELVCRGEVDKSAMKLGFGYKLV